MTDRPYTDDDLRAAAALMHHALTTQPNPADASAALSDNPRWLLVNPGSEYDKKLREATVELVSKAADISAWAVHLGADGLQPADDCLSLKGDGRPIVRIHFAFDPVMPDDVRQHVINGVAQAIDAEL